MAIITKFDNAKFIFMQNEALQNLHGIFESCLNGEFKKGDFKENKHITLKDGVFAILQKYNLKDFKEAFFESHNKYVDFQLTIKGGECFMLGDSTDFKILKKYNEKKDLTTYSPSKKANTILSNRANLCIFFPNDVHAGGLKNKNLKNNEVFKVVAKVPKELLTSYYN